MNLADYLTDKDYEDVRNRFAVDEMKERLCCMLRKKYDDGTLDDDDIFMLSKLIGEDIPEDDSDDIVTKYAANLKNYLYQYKPEATTVDSSINPEENQIGIMAQDLEKVNPACVKETPEGVKVVDAERLALMNAGVIADLARRLEALEAKFNG